MNTGGTLTDTFTVLTQDETSEFISITINGLDDSSVITGTIKGEVTEEDILTVTGDLNHTDADANNANDVWQVQTAQSTTYGTYSIDATGNWTYHLDNTNTAVQGLNTGQTLTESLIVLTEDGTSQVVSITINGKEDDIVITGRISGLVIEDRTLIATGDLNYTDVDSNDVNDVWQVQTTQSATYGTYSIDATGNWTYNLDSSHEDIEALNLGESLTDTFTVFSKDETNQLITITINGTSENNTPAIITGKSTGEVTEDGTLIATGELDHTDTDNDDDVWQVQTNELTTYGSYSIDATGNWTYHLDNANVSVQGLNTGETLTESFIVLTEDSTSQIISMTINGGADSAIISGDSTGAVEEDGTLSVTGYLNHIDDDDDDDVWQVQTNQTTSYGTYSIDSSGTWMYNLDNANSAIQALNKGLTVIDTFTVLTGDGTSEIVSITITGEEDPAVISGDRIGTVVEDGSPIIKVLSDFSLTLTDAVNGEGRDIDALKSLPVTIDNYLTIAEVIGPNIRIWNTNNPNGNDDYFSNSVKAPVITVNFGSSQIVDSIIFWKGGRGTYNKILEHSIVKEFDLAISDNGIDFTTVETGIDLEDFDISGSFLLQDRGLKVSLSQAYTASYIRLILTDNYHDFGYFRSCLWRCSE